MTFEVVDELRAFGKWAAVGGPVVLSFFNPVASVFGSLLGEYFLLFDPDATADNSVFAVRFAHPNAYALRKTRKTLSEMPDAALEKNHFGGIGR